MGIANWFACCCGGKLSRALGLLRPLSQLASSLTRSTVARSRDSLYDPVLADSEREAVADLLGFLENVRHTTPPSSLRH